jgi:glycosyltransferase involved in cell wall biosynthesis
VLVSRRPRLLFVSPRFLLPADSGGRIRTTEVLRNLKGGRFEVTLACPGSGALERAHDRELQQLADRRIFWPERGDARRKLRLALGLLSSLPASVAIDRNPEAQRVIGEELRTGVDVAVFDFVHAAVLVPQDMKSASVLFTHNVEAEIFERHLGIARRWPTRLMWASQTKKMAAFERAALGRFDGVIAVSGRDKLTFIERYGAARVSTIPTGVDLGRFQPQRRGDAPRVVFIGSMDWLPNVDAIRFFMDSVWPGIVREVPDATMTVVGRAPPRDLVAAAEKRGLAWKFTGYVEDIRPHVLGAAVSVIPLRIGGGTRIKAFEAMAMGVPVVSTAIGVEGLPITDGEHYLLADTAEAMSGATSRVLRSRESGARLAAQARALVEERFSNRSVARHFEDICFEALRRRGSTGTRQPLAAGERYA